MSRQVTPNIRPCLKLTVQASDMMFVLQLNRGKNKQTDKKCQAPFSKENMATHLRFLLSLQTTRIKKKKKKEKFFRLTRPTWYNVWPEYRALRLAKPNTPYQLKCLIPTVRQGGGGLIIQSPQYLFSLKSFRWHYLLFILKYSKVKCEAICLTAKAGPKVRSRCKPNHQINNRVAIKDKNELLQCSSRSPDPSSFEIWWWDLKTAMQKSQSTETKSTEEEGKISSQQYETMIKVSWLSFW